MWDNISTRGFAFMGSDGSDNISTSSGTDSIYGGVGNDYISAQTGTSSDTFMFNLGDGVDVINSYDGNATGVYAGKDKIVFGKDIAADMVGYRREGNNPIITVGSQGDQISINDYFSGTFYRTINRFEFADGTVWNANVKVDASFGYNETPAPAKPMAVEAQVNSLISVMAAFAPESGSALSLPTHTYDPNSVMLVSSAA